MGHRLSQVKTIDTSLTKDTLQTTQQLEATVKTQNFRPWMHARSKESSTTSTTSKNYQQHATK